MLSSDPSQKEAPVTAVGFVGLGTAGSALSSRRLAAGDETAPVPAVPRDLPGGPLADHRAGTGLSPAGAELPAERDAAALFGPGLAGRPAVRW
jgi:hypothetical protein